MQSRTFTQDEEAATTNFNHFEPSIEAVYIINSNNGEPVGILGNYQRYGLDDDPDGTLSKEKQQGSNSRQCIWLTWMEYGHSALYAICLIAEGGGSNHLISFPSQIQIIVQQMSIPMSL